MVKKKRRDIINIDTGGLIECPRCWCFFGPGSEGKYTAGRRRCPWCKRWIRLTKLEANIGNACVHLNGKKYAKFRTNKTDANGAAKRRAAG